MMQLPREDNGAAVERGNLPNSKRCSGSRPMAGDNTRTITLPLRREWPLTCQGLPAPQTRRLPYCSIIMRTELPHAW